MDGLTRTRRHVEAAWHSFLLDGALPPGVRPEILRSWQRVRGELHVDPGLRSCPNAMGVEEALARARSEDAHRVASRLVSHFADRLAPDGHVVAYFDVDGVMLSLDGNRATRSRLADVNFAPGSCWSEKAAGTNGPGTALAEARPVEVFATEHFVEAWQAWNCASVPVRIAERTIGVVDITSPWSARNPSLLLTAEAIAQAIASEIEADAARQQTAMVMQVARDALRARDEVLTVVSHELKTPLTPLRLKLEQLERVLARGGEPVDPGQLARLLQGADRNIGRLVRFVDDLLDASRVLHEPLLLSRAPTDLSRTVHDGVDRHRSDLERLACAVRVRADRDVVGRWDAARLAVAFEQLLVNAMRYAPGPIDVEVRREAQTASLLVRDHGPGISPDDQARIFLPYERAVSSRNASGLGLGLHSVRRIVEAHGGTVGVQSAPGAGATFVLELPLDAEDALEAGAAHVA